MNKNIFYFVIAGIIVLVSSSCQSPSKPSDNELETSTNSSKSVDKNTNIKETADTSSFETDYNQHAFQEKDWDYNETPKIVKAIFNEALMNGQAYEALRTLTQKVGARLSGSPEAAAAVEWAYQTMDTMGIEKIWKQEVKVPRWIRGSSEKARVLNSVSQGSKDLAIAALGGSVATPSTGINAEVIEIKYFNELEQLGKKNIEGKIVFFNRKMDARFINTFYAYSGCVDQRWAGASKAASYGAVAVLVRSMTLALDNYPHTGSMGYEEGVNQIPAAALSTMAAESLSTMLKEQNDLRVFFSQSCKTLPDVWSHNVIGEIRGSEFPDEIILVGGHLDSWDLGEGAHDDGAGCVQSIEVLRILQSLGIRPKRTIRAVMFMNEENGLRGGTKYADIAAAKNEKHILAVETDRGGFAPQYFTVENMSEAQWEKLQSLVPLLKEYGIYDIKEGGGGADISPLKTQGAVLMGLVPETQRYFDYHHCALDKLEAVNPRELHLGAAAMAALVWLVAEKGL